MIRFFRRVREKLIGEGNVRRYLLYAIGEILLVIIGILIALQINNLNEAAKQRATIDKIMLDIREELSQEIESTEISILSTIRFDSVRADFLISNYTADDLAKPEHSNVDDLANVYSATVTSRNAYEILLERKDIVPQDLDSLLILLNMHYGTSFEFLKTFENIVRDFSVNYIDYRREHFEWFGLADQNTRASNEYFANDWRHRNNIVYHRRFNMGYLMQIIDYRETALQVFQEISKIYDLPSLPDLPYLKVEYLDQFEGFYEGTDEFGNVSRIRIYREGNRLKLEEPTNTLNLYPFSEMEFYSNNGRGFYEFRPISEGRFHLYIDRINSLLKEREYIPVEEEN